MEQAENKNRQCDNELRQCFNTLPPFVQENIMQTGVQLRTPEQLQKCAEHLTHPNESCEACE